MSSNIDFIGKENDITVTGEAIFSISIPDFLMFCSTQQLKNELARREVEIRDRMKGEKARLREKLKFRQDQIKKTYE